MKTDPYCEPWRSPDTRAFPELALLERILSEVPRFGDGRACGTVDARLFDANTLEDARAARAICLSCPVLKKCADWVRLPANRGRLEGVAAGHLRGSARVRFSAEMGRKCELT